MPQIQAIKLLTVLALSVLGTAAPQARAQAYPTKPITLVVPYPPGSATDIVARLFQPKIEAALKQSVIIENRDGASTNIGTAFVAHAAPDGYTVLLQAPNIATNEFAFKNPHWKRDEFAPVGTLVRWSNVLVAGPSAPTHDLKALLALSNTASLNYGSPGVGSLSQLAVEMLKRRSGLAMEHVTFRGPAPMINNLIGGYIQYGVTNPANFMTYVNGAQAKLFPVAVMGTQRDSTIPKVPTLADFGIRGIESYGWMGLLVPAKTPPEAIKRLNTEFMKVLADPEVVAKLKANYLEPYGGTPEEFGRFMDAENKKWGDAAKAAGIEPE